MHIDNNKGKGKLMINRKRVTNSLLVPSLLTFCLGSNLMAAETGRVSTAEYTSTEQTRLKDEKLSVIPLIGTIAFVDPTDTGTGKAAYGLAIEANAMSWQNDEVLKDWYVGASSGFIFSHLGSNSSNFFGADPDRQDGAGGANMVLIPVDLKVGYHVMENVRVSAFGGGNVMYRSIKSSFDSGGDFASDNSSDWTMYPNLGASVEVGLANNVALTVRPDLTFTPGVVAFDGMFGIGLSL